MSRRLCFVQLMMVLAMSGCAMERVTKTQPVYAIIGVVGKPPAAMDYCFVNLADINLDNKTLRQEFDARKYITTRSILKLEIVALPKTNVLALFGPNFGSAELARAKIENTDPMVFIECGWVYLTGQTPLIETPYGTAGANGSAIAVQIFESAGVSVHRVYFLKGSSARVWTTKMDKIMGTIGYFVDMNADGTITAPAPISSNADATAFQSNLLLTIEAAI